jgi:hypothetical protein
MSRSSFEILSNDDRIFDVQLVFQDLYYKMLDLIPVSNYLTPESNQAKYPSTFETGFK